MARGGGSLLGRVAPALGSPEERRWACVVNGILYAAAGLGAVVYAVLDSDVDHGWLLYAGGAFSVAWAAVLLVLRPLARPGMWWVAHATSVTGLLTIGTIYLGTHGTAAGVLGLLWLVVVYTALFYRPVEAFGYALAAGVLDMAVVTVESGPLEDVAESSVRFAAYLVVSLLTAATAARLREMTQDAEQAREAEERLADEQAALRRMATAIAAGSPPPAVFALLSAEAGRLFGAHMTGVARFLPGDRALVVGHWGPLPDEHRTGALMSIARTASFAAIRDNGEAVRVGRAGDPALGALPEVHEVVAAPIVISGEPWGAVSLMGRESGCFAPDTEQRLSEIADLAATAIIGADSRERLTTLAATDALTGVANRAAFEQHLATEVARARRHGRELAVMVADVDGMTAVNDREGTRAGDRLLEAVAEALVEAARVEDVVARVGGDEFAVVLPEAGRAAALVVAERLRADVAAAGARLTAGLTDLAVSPDPPALLRDAQRALVAAKRQGGDRTLVYDAALAVAPPAPRTPRATDRDGALAGLRALARAVDAKDPATRQHAERVAELAQQLAARLGWSPDRQVALREAALLHDVGKIGIPDAILLKPGRLDDDEMAVVKTHPELGALIVGDVLAPEQVRWIAAHHERPDGRGYPQGLRGADLPDGAAIIALADAFDVMTAARAYRDPVAPETALAECRELAGRQFVPDVVAALEAVVALPSAAR